ncbi:MAG: AAA family ATPase [Methanomicrobiales archaeon]|nr:AAA family ATPase [Methanomicrobiales archaeon]
MFLHNQRIGNKDMEGSHIEIPSIIIETQIPLSDSDRSRSGFEKVQEFPAEDRGTLNIKPPENQEFVNPPESDSVQWPPLTNALGMIGQDQAVNQLIKQVNFSRASKRRFPDKLLVGPAGVGKSSLARAIARGLLGEQEILFNGADLRLPIMIVNRLNENQKIQRNPQNPHAPIRVSKCLIFIDEVHAISSNVAATLLNAMDDQRITTIDGVNYDFCKVVFILATTDPGKLSEAFNSRPDKTYLRPYNLPEVAGIVWLHGKEILNGYDLPRDVCYEIAARIRCQPRRAVRSLTQLIIPYFHGETHNGDEPVDYERIASALTRSAIASWFDEQDIDMNGLDPPARNYLGNLKRTGAMAEKRLQQALGISNHTDFIEVDEYLIRLGLVKISTGGRILTSEGNRYISKSFDLRERISRQIS